MAETLTVADFLLARIAEDEESVDLSPRRKGWDIGHEGGEFWEVSPSPEYDTVYMSHQRLSAECEAKRAVLRLATGPRVVMPSGAVLPVDQQTLHLLALPYADHPDYRDEWRL